jgi:hypothetical protein
LRAAGAAFLAADDFLLGIGVIPSLLEPENGSF